MGKPGAFVRVDTGKPQNLKSNSNQNRGKPGYVKKNFSKFSKKPIEKPAWKKKIAEKRSNEIQKKKDAEDQRVKDRLEAEKQKKLAKQKRLERTKMISKRTKSGQPLMKDRIEFLLKQIQESKK
ncbi:hypothetical protein ACFFRR_011751 [Megaselia abdita]